MIIIKAITDTILKRLPVAHDMLPDNKKAVFLEDCEIFAIRYKIENQHIVFESSDAKYFGKWYAPQTDIEIMGA